MYGGARGCQEDVWVPRLQKYKEEIAFQLSASENTCGPCMLSDNRMALLLFTYK